MKSFAIPLFTSILVLLTACENVDLNKISTEDVNKVIVCPDKYIRFGASCCLDQNENKICDDDEKKEQSSEGCEDECSIDSCLDFDYSECLMKSDGCKDKKFRGKIKGKCGVECTTDNDCDLNEKCEKYKCIQKEEGIIYTTKFTISQDTYDKQIDTIYLRFIPLCEGYQSSQILNIKVNGLNIFSAKPICNDRYKQLIPVDYTTIGENKIEFISKEKYNIDSAEVDIKTIKEECTVGFKCLDQRRRGYQSANCMFSQVEECNYACENGVCVKECTTNNDCVDREPCTIDECGGEPVRCRHKLILQCVNDDGCCPTSKCTAKNDNDCKIRDEMNLANYPSPFIVDGKFSGLIVVGDDASTESVIGASDISTSLQYSVTGTAKIEVGATKMASEVADIKAQNIISVGNPCENAATAEVKGNPVDCKASYTDGKGYIELIDTGADNIALLVAGYNPADTKAAASILSNYEDYVFRGVKCETVTSTLTLKCP